EREAPGRRIVLRPCPEWVLAVEHGVVEGEPARALVRPAVREVLEQGADVLVLGCTHFPFLAAAIRAEPGELPILDPGEAVARQLQRVLDAQGLHAVGARAGTLAYYASGDAPAFSSVAAQLMHGPVQARPLPAPYA